MADADKQSSEKREYHKKATGNALNTVKNHSKENDLKLYGSCFWCATLASLRSSLHDVIL